MKMKNFTTTIMTLTMAAALAVMPAAEGMTTALPAMAAEDVQKEITYSFESNGLYGTLTAAQIENNELAITGYEGEAAVIEIPAEINGYAVTMIADSAFREDYDGSHITSVTIPDGVTTIADGAFYRCAELAAVSVPDSVTSIGSYAFYCCTSLTDITIPDGVTVIADGTFYGCASLTDIAIPDGVTRIGNNAFYYCSALEGITIPDSVTEIGAYAFSYCKSIAEITVPDSVTAIGAGVFCQMAGLTDVTIPDGVKVIGDYTFSGCTSLTDITIPDGVTSIGRCVFQNTGLKDVTFLSAEVPELAETCDSWADVFYKTDELANIYVPAASCEAYAAALKDVTADTEINVTALDAATATPEQYDMGDVDFDGSVTAKDALAILQHVVNLSALAEEALALADVDGNGVVEAADALTILQTVVDLKAPALSETTGASVTDAAGVEGSTDVQEAAMAASLTNEVVVDEEEGTVTYTATLTNTGETSLDAWALYDTTINDRTFAGLDLQSVTAEYYEEIRDGEYAWQAFYNGDHAWGISEIGDRGWKVFCTSELSDTIGAGEAIRVTAVYAPNGEATNIISTAEFSATGLGTDTEITGSTAAAIKEAVRASASITDKVSVEGDTVTYTVTLTNTGNTPLDNWSVFDTNINLAAYEGLTLQSVTAEYYEEIRSGEYAWQMFYDGDNAWGISEAGSRGWKVFCTSELSDTIGVGEAIRVTVTYATDGTVKDFTSFADYTAAGLDNGDMLYGTSVAQ